MSSLTLYRARVPAHGGVSDTLVEAAIEDAASAHTPAAWGARYAEAMVLFAAHTVERTPGSGANGNTAAETGAVTSQSDSQSTDGGSSSLSRSYATPQAQTPEADELSTTIYGRRYLAIRASRAATAPTCVLPE